MKTFVTNAESLIKQSPSHPWGISLTSPSGDSLFKATIGNGGQAEMGPRLFEVLSAIEGRNHVYPLSVTWDMVNDFEDEFTVRELGGAIVYVELEIASYKHFLKRGGFVEGFVSTATRIMEELPSDEEEEAIHPEGDTGELFTISNATGSLGKKDFFLVGRLDTAASSGGVRDGDTIDLKIEFMGSKVAGAVPDNVDVPPVVGGSIPIRFVGIQTPETADHDSSYGDDKNNEYALKFNITSEDAYKVGAEATDYVSSVLTGDGYIVIDLDVDSQGKIQHTYGRLMGVVYKTKTNELSDIENGDAGTAINVNKSLLVEKSKEVANVPLAIVYSHFANNTSFSRFDVAVWEYDLGLKERQPGDASVGEITDQLIEEYVTPKASNAVEKDPIEVRYSEASEYDNRLNWFKPLDDRMEEDGLNLPLLSEHNVRIGDVMLVIPPLSIQYNRTSSSEKVKTLRTKQSTILRSGNSESTITLQLYFHDLDSINGHEWTNPGGISYHMDGLRSLIAQFKKAPFLPIDNPYINEVLDIDDVALIDISVNTVPGFPNSMSATLRLAKFDISPMMPQATSLGSVINYPMLRWYYQEAMREHASPLRTTLKKITEDTHGDFNFLLADEMELMRRQNAIQKMRQTSTPQQIMEDVQNGDNQFGRLIKDAKTAEKLLAQQERYYKMRAEGRILFAKSEDPKYDPYGESSVLGSGFGIHPQSELNGEDGRSPSYNHVEVFYELYADVPGIDIAAPGNADAMKVNGNYFAPYESFFFAGPPIGSEAVQEKYQFQKIWGGDDDVDDELRLAYYNNRHEGFFDIVLETGSNQGLFDDAAKMEGEENRYIVPAIPWNVEKLKKIIAAGKDAELGAQQSIDEYHELETIAEVTEGNLALQRYEIDGLICTSVNVSYQNHFAGVNMPSIEGPTMQYLGGQDPLIHASFEADEEAVEDLRLMLEDVDRYAREYKHGITSGFMGVENGIAGLFGINAVIPEHVVVSTVPNFPGRFHIEMTLCGFDKTQRRTETLEGLSPLYSVGGESGNASLSDRHYSNGDMSMQDNSVFEYRMRTLETYADLELPTYSELNAALPKIGADLVEYKNPSRAKFVDPDFYVATEWTMREEFRTQRNGDQRMEFRDMVGVKMYTDSSNVNSPIDGDDENWTLLRSIDEKTTRIDPRHQKGGDNEYNADRSKGMGNMAQASPEQEIEKKTYDTPSDVKSLLEDSNQQRTQPTYDEWASWGIGISDNYSPRGSSEQIRAHLEGVYQDWLLNPNPSQVQIYDFIHRKVDSLWKSYYYEDSDKNPDNTSWYDIAYSKGSVDIFKANYLSITGEDPASLIENSDPDGEDSTIAPSDWETFVGGKIPKSRLRNLVKATFHYMSRWTQYSGGGYPDQIGHGVSLEVGIARLRIAEEAENKAEARRMMWDWQYNLEYGIKKLFDAYEKAATSSDNVKKAAPWDWMLHAWDDPELASTSVDSDFFRNVYSRFEKSYNNWALRYGTAQSPVEISLLKRGESVTSRQMQLLKGDSKTMLQDLEAVGENVEKYKDVEKYGDAQIKELYEEKMYELFGYHTHSTVYLASNGSKIADQTFQNLKRSKYPDQWENWKVYQMTMESIQSAKDAFNLVNYKNPEEMYKGMFTDMIDYDMRGRLVRAFPTFQMFIIDEGRWMTDYRLWDNMYGFNAITSIDVHKNRKIIADTAVVKMTNVYSNLTQRPLSTQYKDWDYSFWSNLLFGNPSEELLDARSELLDGMLLQTGARIHLRMGYGSSVEHLPVVFNGTITEMDTDQVMTIVAQGDGMELTNVISGDPDDDNKDWGVVKEPRDTICNLMTSKGNWFKDAINYTSGGKFFRDNPLGIQHFGMPSGDTVPAGTLNWFNKDYGEVAQNIYSSNGSNTYSKWVAGGQSAVPFTWDGWTPAWNGNDEMNIKLNFYNKTVWDVISTIAMCSPDYVAAVVPFELRSTLFFGKPYYAMAYRYDSKYVYDEKEKQWLRNLENETRKPFMQFHWYGNDTDIVSNKIKANADIFTNVIATYDGGEQSPIAYADWDIRYDKQRTTVVDAPIMKQAFDFWTSEDQARMYAYSAVKENMKDMYQGSLVVLGDPSLKPHDMCYLGDQINDMTGNFQVKDVTHSFSLETGFISTITPDAVVVNDDQAFMNMAAWYASASAAVLTRFIGIRIAAKAGKMMMGKAMAQKHIKAGTAYGAEYTKRSMHRLIKKLPKHDADVAEYKKGYRAWLKATASGNATATTAAIAKMDGVIDKLTSTTKVAEWEEQGLFDKKGSKFKTKRLLSLMKTGTSVMKNGKNAFFLFRAAGTTILGTTPIGWILTLGSIILTETLSEMYQRKKANYQCVLMMPLKHQGRYFEAGINGHKGMVIGDTPGKMDNYLAGAGWTDDPNAKDEDHFDLLIDTFNFLANEDGNTVQDAYKATRSGVESTYSSITSDGHTGFR